MPIYLVTNKDTHARAVVVARNASGARSLRPDSDLQSVVWRGGRWLKLGQTPSADRAAPPLECWPDDLERVHADEIGSAGRMYSGSGARQVVTFDRDSQLRQPGEGPDESWGSRFDELTQLRAAYLRRSSDA